MFEGSRIGHNQLAVNTSLIDRRSISEATHLKCRGAIDRQRMVLRIEQGKGQKDRYVMLSVRLLDILTSYWRVARPKDWLFPGTSDDRPITRQAVGLACEKAHARSGLTKPVSPHGMRHYIPILIMSGSAVRTAAHWAFRRIRGHTTRHNFLSYRLMRKPSKRSTGR
ncbi:tyrosine-type recombinase/integrase [Sphingobium sp. EM0848]|uniref:tyrosine-type recombinase/integrase n=1 Tax=Sphingobium sp. EM0848 TaxID=2743473 RepID=UPI00159C8BE8